MPISYLQAPVLLCDNVSATYLSSNPMIYSRMKRLTLDYHFVRQQVQSGLIMVSYICSKDQLADEFNKSLARQRIVLHQSKTYVSDGAKVLRGHINDQVRVLFQFKPCTSSEQSNSYLYNDTSQEMFTSQQLIF